MLGNNLFAYCFNNPVNSSDGSGNWPKWLSGALNVVSGTLQAAAGAVLGATVGWTGIGAVAAAALVINGAATATQGIGQIVNAVTQANTMREDNIIRTGVQRVGSAIGGDVGSSIAGMAYDTAIMAAAVYAPTARPPVSSTQATFTSRGSTATRQPSNLTEKLALEEVMSNPQGKQLPIVMSDPRWPASEGWVKMQQVINTHSQGKITVHYTYNTILGIFDDFKLK